MDARELGEGLGEGAGRGWIGIAGALYTRTGETRRGLVREHEMQSDVPTIICRRFLIRIRIHVQVGRLHGRVSR